MKRIKLLTSLVVVAIFAEAQQKQPNILVIWGDDIGWQNVSAYGMGTMGYTTPRIDSIGMEGIRFTDHYAQPSCTAGRASFIPEPRRGDEKGGLPHWALRQEPPRRSQRAPAHGARFRRILRQPLSPEHAGA